MGKKGQVEQGKSDCHGYGLDIWSTQGVGSGISA